MENVIEQFTNRIIKKYAKREEYIYVLQFKDSHQNGSNIEYIEQNGDYSRTTIRFGSDYAKFKVIPVAEEIDAYNKYFYQYFEPTERMKAYIKKLEENKK
jgi:hypothetical protein